jgi:hypothetical protein
MCSTNVVFTAGMPHAEFTLINGTSLAGVKPPTAAIEQQQLPPTTVWDIFQQHQLIGTPLYTVRKGQFYLDVTYCIENMIRMVTHFFSIPGFKLNESKNAAIHRHCKCTIFLTV